MSNETYKPGPWSYQMQKRNEWDNSSLCWFSSGWISGSTNEQVEATARLITAAPEMLRMLERLHGYFKDGLDDKVFAVIDEGIPSILKRIRGDE